MAIATITPTPTPTDPGPFVFSQYSFDSYHTIDRAGFPGSNLLLNLSGDKEAYNQSSPKEDADNMKGLGLLPSDPIAISLNTWHQGVPGMETINNTGLDDDFIVLGWDACIAPSLPMDNCDDQSLKFFIPDVLAIIVGGMPNFPNGLRPGEAFVDRVLALIWLDLDIPGNDLTLLDLDGDGILGPSLNPLENDVALPSSFPYLAEAH